MAKPELGEKQVCENCGAKFYDLGRRPAVCPKCGHTFDPTEVKPKAPRPSKAVAHPPPEDDEEEEAKTVEEDEDDLEEPAAPELDAEADAVVTKGGDDDDDDDDDDDAIINRNLNR